MKSAPPPAASPISTASRGRAGGLRIPLSVMPGLVPGTHVGPKVLSSERCSQPHDVDGRVKPGHDGREQRVELSGHDRPHMPLSRPGRLQRSAAEWKESRDPAQGRRAARKSRDRWIPKRLRRPLALVPGSALRLRRRWSGAREQAPHLTIPPALPLVAASKVPCSHTGEKGNAVRRGRPSNAAAAPATVGGEPLPDATGSIREGGRGGEPRARRPAFDEVRAGRGAPVLRPFEPACAGARTRGPFRGARRDSRQHRA
ncbi:hypothetical protein GGQ86_002732 [Xanthobacter flavus]|uniref:Uncharacterized protein n=1 Tax=Xanthobacter flavus TaxID=281 RepID=A0ABU1KHF4_XANFL|nr:hypothetical protein [Xanthobacter flavus]